MDYVLSSEEISSLDDHQLLQHLKACGLNPGPILSSTRKIYEKRLLTYFKHLSENNIAPVTLRSSDSTAASDEHQEQQTKKAANLRRGRSSISAYNPPKAMEPIRAVEKDHATTMKPNVASSIPVPISMTTTVTAKPTSISNRPHQVRSVESPFGQEMPTHIEKTKSDEVKLQNNNSSPYSRRSIAVTELSPTYIHHDQVKQRSYVFSSSSSSSSTTTSTTSSKVSNDYIINQKDKFAERLQNYGLLTPQRKKALSTRSDLYSTGKSSPVTSSSSNQTSAKSASTITITRDVMRSESMKESYTPKRVSEESFRKHQPHVSPKKENKCEPSKFIMDSTHQLTNESVNSWSQFFIVMVLTFVVYLAAIYFGPRHYEEEFPNRH